MLARSPKHLGGSYYHQKKSSAPSSFVLSIYPNDDCRHARGGAADRGEYRRAAGTFAEERLVIQFLQSQKRRLRITPGLCFCSPDCFHYFTRVRLRCGNKNDYG